MISPYNGLQLALGLTVWLAWFSVIYGLLSVVCAVAPPPAEQGPLTWINGVLLLLTLVTTALLLFWAWRCYRAAKRLTTVPHEAQPIGEQEIPSRRFIAYVAAGVHLVAAVSTLGVGLTAVYLPSCL